MHNSNIINITIGTDGNTTSCFDVAGSNTADDDEHDPVLSNDSEFYTWICVRSKWKALIHEMWNISTHYVYQYR